MNIHRIPKKKEIQKLDDLVFELFAKERAFDACHSQIDRMLGELLVGDDQLISTQLQKLIKNNKLKIDDENSLISAMISPKAKSEREGVNPSKARFRALREVIGMLATMIKPEKFDYYSEEFRKLRLMVFMNDGEVCAKCGATPKPNFWLEIDHIKPVSKYPELALDIDNLQVLCKDCNREKSNIDETDYRRKSNALRNY